MVGFSYNGMFCRLVHAAFYFNENSGRKQAFTKDGHDQYIITYPKYKKRGYIARERKVDSTLEYVKTLMNMCEIIAIETRITSETKETLNLAAPGPLCEHYFKPAKELAVQKMTSRFYRKETVV